MPLRDPPLRTSEDRWSPLQAAALALGYAALWAVVGRYYGLQHDAQIYALQALAKLDPEVFNGDLYMKFGSQDDFTLYSNFSAPWIGLLGVDHGAAALTLASVILWIVAAWILARVLVGSTLAWAAIGLLLTLPCWYGSGQVFQLVERFMNARLPAEAICLLALAALIRRRYAAMGAAFALALVTHPLMTVPCMAIGAVYSLQKTGRGPTPAAWVLALGCATLVAAWLLGFGSPLMTGDWLEAVRSRSGFLFLDTWSLVDWQLTLLPLVTLAIAARDSPSGDGNRLARAGGIVAVAGLLVAAFVSWVLPLKVAVQIQAWRWIWVAGVLAIVMLAPTLSRLWKQGASGRACALLLATAWILGNASQASDSTAAVGCIAMIAAPGILRWRDRLPASTDRLLLVGASLLLACTTAWAVSLAVSESSVRFDFGGDPYWVQRVAGVLKIPAMAAIAVVALWLALLKRPGTLRMAVATTSSLVLLVAAAPGAWAAWSSRRFDADARSTFAEWRTVIGAEQEVLWPEGLPWTWLALERRSYLAFSQLSGIVFSEETSNEARRRAAGLAASFPPGTWFNEVGTTWPPAEPTTAAGVMRVCSAPGVDFYVSAADVGLATARAEWPTRGMYVYLYDCGRLRRQSTR